VETRQRHHSGLEPLLSAAAGNSSLFLRWRKFCRLCRFSGCSLPFRELKAMAAGRPTDERVCTRGPNAIGVPAIDWARASSPERCFCPTSRQLVITLMFRNPTFRLEAVSENLRLRSSHLLPSASGLEIQSTSLWWSNRIDLNAQFGRTGRLPQLARSRRRNSFCG